MAMLTGLFLFTGCEKVEKGADGHTHKVKKWEVDSTSHYAVCAICGESFSSGQHEFKDERCKCGATKGIIEFVEVE